VLNRAGLQFNIGNKMFIKLKHGEHWLYKPRKKKLGMKQKFSKPMIAWLKQNISSYHIIKDGPLSGILIQDENEAMIFKLTWFSTTKSNSIITFIKKLGKF